MRLVSLVDLMEEVGFTRHHSSYGGRLRDEGLIVPIGGRGRSYYDADIEVPWLAVWFTLLRVTRGPEVAHGLHKAWAAGQMYDVGREVRGAWPLAGDCLFVFDQDGTLRWTQGKRGQVRALLRRYGSVTAVPIEPAAQAAGSRRVREMA